MLFTGRRVAWQGEQIWVVANLLKLQSMQKKIHPHKPTPTNSWGNFVESKRARISGDLAIFDFFEGNITPSATDGLPAEDSDLGRLGMCGLVAKDCVDKKQESFGLEGPCFATGQCMGFSWQRGNKGVFPAVWKLAIPNGMSWALAAKSIIWRFAPPDQFDPKKMGPCWGKRLEGWWALIISSMVWLEP